MHHIVSDGWSIKVLIRELGELYDAHANHRDAALPDLPIQYADFAVWQRGWLQGERLEEQLSYWKTQLADAPPLLALPTDRPRPTFKTFHGADVPLSFSKTLSEDIARLSRREGATLFMTLLAAFSTLLYRYSGQRDILVGTPIANRNRAAIHAFTNLFPHPGFVVIVSDLFDPAGWRAACARRRAFQSSRYFSLTFSTAPWMPSRRML